MSPRTAIIPTYLSCYKVDRIYHLMRGTARAAALAGVIPCAARKWGTREAYLIRLDDAEKKWGAK